MKKNNTRIIDILMLNLKDTDFDHHSRYFARTYGELIELVPTSMAEYLDARLK